MKKLLIPLLAISSLTFAANTPCSGSKGGIDHCDGRKFICVDGSVSASKKICPAGFPVKNGEGVQTKQTKAKSTKSTSANSGAGAGSAFNPDASN